jgi:hypothetical protein
LEVFHLIYQNQSNVIKVIGVGEAVCYKPCLNKELKEWILLFVILILRHYKVVQFNTVGRELN